MLSNTVCKDGSSREGEIPTPVLLSKPEAQAQFPIDEQLISQTQDGQEEQRRRKLHPSPYCQANSLQIDEANTKTKDEL